MTGSAGFCHLRVGARDNPAGGVKAAYEVGALKALIEQLPAQEVAYDIVSGVSMGAMNSALMSLFKKGDEKAALEYMSTSRITHIA